MFGWLGEGDSVGTTVRVGVGRSVGDGVVGDPLGLGRPEGEAAGLSVVLGLSVGDGDAESVGDSVALGVGSNVGDSAPRSTGVICQGLPNTCSWSGATSHPARAISPVTSPGPLADVTSLLSRLTIATAPSTPAITTKTVSRPITTCNLLAPLDVAPVVTSTTSGFP